MMTMTDNSEKIFLEKNEHIQNTKNKIYITLQKKKIQIK